jgi:hypothetical protein
LEKVKLKKISLGATVEDQFDLIGILAPLKSYVLAHHLNSCLHFALFRDPEDLIYPQKEFDTYHPCYRYTEPDSHCKIYLLGNKGGGSLLPERKEYDCLLIYKGLNRPTHFQPIIQTIRAIPGVQYAESLKSGDFKSLGNHPISLLPSN